jgi:hypothetical protein
VAEDTEATAGAMRESAQEQPKPSRPTESYGSDGGADSAAVKECSPQRHRDTERTKVKTGGRRGGRGHGGERLAQ